MNDLFWARTQMGLSLGFHIVFDSISMVVPFYMALTYRRYLLSRDAEHLRLAKAWTKGTAVLFATGAVSGTALGFQLGLLWPGFMEHAGPIIALKQTRGMARIVERGCVADMSSIPTYH